MKIKFLSFLMVLCLVSVISRGQTKLESSIDQFYEALKNAKTDLLSELIDDSLTYGHSSGNIETKTKLIESVSSGKSDFVKIEITDQQIRTFKNMALVRHVLIADTNDNGNPGKIKLHIFQVWKKEKKHWKLVGRQSVRLPS